MTRTVLVGVQLPDRPGPSAVEITDGVVTFVGPAADGERRGPGAEVVRLPGALLTPAFVDAHVHTTAAGLLADGLDLTRATSARAVLDAVAARTAARPGALVWGHGWQEQRWPDGVPSRAELDRAAAGAPVYLSRVDVHSALVSTALVDRAPAAVGAPGWSDAALARDAHHHVRRAALAAVDGPVRATAQRAFLRSAAARGVAVVHECAGPDISSATDLRDLLALATDPGLPEVVGYWGETVTTPDEARARCAATGAHGLAGDLFVDGSLGSHTAALREPYADAPSTCGHTYLDVDAVAAHVTACTRAGVQAGFHVIGDAATDVLVAGLSAAAAATSVAAVRARRHRVEHLEMVDPQQAAVLAHLGVVASVQPLFDAEWGGPDGMYATRLGRTRAAALNPFALLAAAGVTLAFGSDAPVTPLDPWAAVDAATAHRTPGSRIPAAAALAAHTTGGHIAAGRAGLGALTVGAPASYALWDGRTCLRTVHRGQTLHAAGG